MKKKYVYSLIIVGILLLCVSAIGTGYGLWLSTKDINNKSAKTLECFKIYFSNSDSIELTNIKPVLNEEGKETSPNTITIKNICNEQKELQIRLNILDGTTTDIKSLVIDTTGSIEKKEYYYKELDNTKTTNPNAIYSKLIGNIKIEPNETLRTNIKIWFDEKKAYNIKREDTFKAQYEIIDKNSSQKPSFAENIIIENDGIINEAVPDFSVASITDDGLNLFVENNKKVYYYRGSVANNYVSFAGYMWRIVKINSDNSIKLVLDKTIAVSKYNEAVNSKDYTGLKYVYNNELVNNTANNHLISWYNENILNKNLDKYVSIGEFCNDSTNYITNYHTYFYGYDRTINQKKPITSCPITTMDFGGVIEQKIGLLTADEVMMAGGVHNTENYSYYLNIGQPYFTMTPAEYYRYRSYILKVEPNGAINTTLVTEESGIRPVINLHSTVTVSGKGTIDNPYTIDLE